MHTRRRNLAAALRAAANPVPPRPKKTKSQWAVPPPLFRTLVDTLGFQTACRVVLIFGGQRIYVPSSTRPIRPNHQLAVLGAERLEKFVAAFSSESLEIPSLSVFRARQRVLRALHRGEPRAAIVAKYHVTDNYVRKLSRQMRRGEMNPFLFPEVRDDKRRLAWSFGRCGWTATDGWRHRRDLVEMGCGRRSNHPAGLNHPVKSAFQQQADQRGIEKGQIHAI